MSLCLDQAISLTGTPQFHDVLSFARLRGGPNIVNGVYTPDDVAVVEFAKNLRGWGLSDRAAIIAAGAFASSRLSRHQWVGSISCDGETIYPAGNEDFFPIGEIYHAAKQRAKLAIRAA